jgi:uncharacterized protein YidB (DUF937 family)
MKNFRKVTVMSGFFGQALGGLLGGGGAAAALPGLLTEIVGAGQGAAGGGLPALLQQFEAAGLGAHVQSWVGGGENMPISAEQVASALPADKLEAWAQQLGVPPETVPALLAHVLPHAVDQATPDGTAAPEAVATPNFGALVGRLFGG